MSLLPKRRSTAVARPDPIFGGRSRNELQFLPAALEIVESPPSPAPRITMLVITAVLVAAIAWASLGRVDVIASAPGRIAASEGGKVIQPLEIAQVADIHVYDGEPVRKGQVLVELQPTDTQADVDQLKSELAAAQLEAARQATVALGRPFSAPAGADPAAAAVAHREARAAAEEAASKVASLDHQAQEYRAELDGAQAEATRLRAELALADQRDQIFRQLDVKGFGSKLQLLDAEDKREDLERSLETSEHRAPELEAQIASTTRARDEAAAEAAHTNLAGLADARLKAASLGDQLTKAEDRLAARTLAAPVDGTVQELAIHTVGGIVQPGQMLMRIAPAQGPLIVEARLANREVGFVRTGMDAQVKVEAFPFTRYGLIHARVLSISRDALSATAPADTPADKVAAQVDPEPQYLVRLALARAYMVIDGRRTPLAPGMAVTAEIKTGRRSIISYVLSPLARSVEEAGRER